MSSSTVFRGLLSRAFQAQELDEHTTAEHPLAPDQLSDDSVMRSIQAGDQQALGVLFDRYSRIVLSVALRILHDASEAQELVQDVFLYIFKKGSGFDPNRSSVRSWLVQVTYSRAFDRRDYLMVRRFYDHCQIDDIVDVVASDFSVETHRQLSETRELLREAFTALNERQRETLRMFFFEGYSLREISARLDETLGNTRNHYYRGLERLRELMTVSLAPAKLRKE